MSEQPRLNLNDMTAQELYDMLQTPGCLHTNILRGLFTLPRMDALHIAGATDYDSLRADNARLREALVIAVDYAVELLGERNWQNGTIERYQTEYDELKAFIEMTRKALANETPTA